MLNERQNKILSLIVENFVKNASPISSKAICETINCSSATVRNEMVTLEDYGYLEKTHTSSGRVPSEAGYRYYVDHLMKLKKDFNEDMLKIEKLFTQNSLAISDLIYESMEVISELTKYTSIVLGSNATNNKLQHVKIVPLSSTSAVALIVTDRGYVENKTIYFNKEVELGEMESIVDLINRYIVGTPIPDVPTKLENDVKPIISQAIKQHEMIYQAFLKAFESFSNFSDIHYSGKNNILFQPEFSDVEKIRDIMNAFEDSKKINQALSVNHNGIQVRIGTENHELGLNDCTIITTSYKIGEEVGKIAVLGPKRMDYDRVVSLLEYLQENLEKNFNK